MPEKRTLRRASQDKEEGKAASTQAGEFVREEIDHIREGKHGARNTKQAIAIGLSKARRSGVALPPPKVGQAKESSRKQAAQDFKKGRANKKPAPNPRRSRATTKALKREGSSAASKQALSKQAHATASKRKAATKNAASPAKRATPNRATSKCATAKHATAEGSTSERAATKRSKS